MKKLHEFTIEGRKFFIRKPSRQMNDDANLFYGVKVAEGIRANMLTVAQLDKRNVNDGGVLSETDKSRQDELTKEIVGLEDKYKVLYAKKEEDRTELEKAELETIKEKLTKARFEYNTIESYRNAAYDNTAEARARNHTLTWWLLNLSFEEIEGKFVPFFGEGSYESKLTKYDSIIEEENETSIKIILKFLTYVSLWHSNRSLTSEDFAHYEKLLTEEEAKNTAEKIKEKETETE